MPPTVLDGDSGEYQYMAAILGVPHSTGYPLYILLGKLFTFIPIGDVAYRINLFSVVFAALTAPLIYWTARRLVARRVAAALAALVMAVTPSMWGGAIEAKTYALHLFLGVLTMFLALVWHQEGRAQVLYLLALVCGLDLTNHPTIRFIAPALLLVLWFNRTRVDRRMVLRSALLVFLPLLLYAYIPIRANQLIAEQDPANKALYGREDAMLKGTVTAYYNNTPQGFINLISGLDNSHKLDVKSPLDQRNRVELSLTLLWQQFGLGGLGLALWGAWESFRRDRRIFSILLAAAAGMGFVGFYLQGISTVFYFSLTYFILSLWIGLGIDGLMAWAEQVRAVRRSHLLSMSASPAVLIPVVALIPLSGLYLNFPRLDESRNYEPRDYAQAVLKSDLPQNAVVVAPWEVSQPIRYFQFVEKQRPDLLVIQVPPVWKQFDTMLANAYKTGRPFYLVEFKPELKSDPGPRSVEAIPLPQLQAPHPRYPISNKDVIPGVQVLGYDLEPDPPQPGKPTRVWIYYRARERIYPMYSAILSVTDLLGKPVGDYAGFPVSFYFPTYRWYELGEYYRDGWMVNWPADAPEGLYNLDLYWYVYDLDTRKPDYDRESHAALGTIRVGDGSAVPIGNQGRVSLGGAIDFLGWNSVPAAASDSIAISRGQPLTLDLFWRTNRDLQESYTVFVHLTDRNGQVVRDADSPPSSGLLPTDHWRSGETVRDRHIMPIPADLAPGDYALEIGMYTPSTGIRLPVGAQDRIVLADVRVK